MEISGIEFAKEVVRLYQGGRDFKTSLNIVEKRYKNYLKEKRIIGKLDNYKKYI